MSAIGSPAAPVIAGGAELDARDRWHRQFAERFVGLVADEAPHRRHDAGDFVVGERPRDGLALPTIWA